MPNEKVSQKPSITTPTSDDLVYLVNDPAGTPTSGQASLTNLTKGVPAVVGDSGSGGTKGLVPAPGAGDAAAGKFLKADGTFAVPPTGGAPSGAAGGVLSGTYPNPTQVISIPFLIDGGGAGVSTGIRGDIGPFDYAGTIQQVTLLADQSGSVVIDIWKDSYANFPPTGVDSITASAKPTISSALKSQDATLTGWTTSITVGDILRVNVDSVSSIQRVTLTLKVLRTS